MGKDGFWEYEPSPSSREDDWIKNHSFTFNEAIIELQKIEGEIMVSLDELRAMSMEELKEYKNKLLAVFPRRLNEMTLSIVDSVIKEKSKREDATN